jgi:non-ribosomal peptide synthetase component F
MYRTGDLARHLGDGSIEYLGRMDNQVKLRGFRIELGEIEAVVRRHEAVREAVVVARAEAAGGGQRLVAYVVGEEGRELAASELRRDMRERLPEYMLPSAFVFLDALPLTPNGKVDRKALPEPGRERGVEGYIAPRSATEEAVAGIWAEVLGVENVGAHDNFFELGGHSLLATQVVSRARQVFGVEVGLRSLFETPTVAGLSETVEASKAGASSSAGSQAAAPALVRVSREAHRVSLPARGLAGLPDILKKDNS